MSDLVGKTILHYKIIEHVGQGGMGVVYKAEDTQLERTVAIKFLPDQIAVDSEERERFKIEAKAAAALNHPNIATIHAIEGAAVTDTNDEMFIVMEYIEGRELQKIVAGQKLSVNSIIDIASQIAEGLKAAHNKGIVHRDIKSTNIMITDEGKVKIMDFGLAKVKGGAQVTKMGTTLGTAAYMSPEQARGLEVDQRSDIWSFGVVLYEMLTGKQPFAGDYEQAVVYSILNEDPEPVAGLRSGVPMELERLVTRAMAKDPDERYQHADEILIDLKLLKGKHSSADRQPSPLKRRAILYIGLTGLVAIAIAAALYYAVSPTFKSASPPPAKIESLAVLPFINIRNDVQIDFLGFALADQVIGSLIYLQRLSVRPSSVVRKYQNQQVDAAVAGSELGVDFVLTGNYLKEGDVIRLNVELVNVQSNNIIWREPIETQYESAFKLQDVVSEKVIAGLQLQFSQEEHDRMHADLPGDPVAYDYYLRSIAYLQSVDGARLAIEMLGKSIQLDSTYAPAFFELGFRFHHLAQYELGSGEYVRRAESMYLKAISLNHEMLPALSNLSMLYAESGKNNEAVELLRRVLNINPNNADGHFALSYVYRYAGMLKEAVNEGERALSLDPKNRRFRSIVLEYYYLGELEKALAIADLDPGSPFAMSWKGLINMRQGKDEQAKDYFNKAIELEPDDVFGLWSLGLKSAIHGSREEGLQALEKWEQTNIVDGEQLYLLGNVYGLLGEKHKCIGLLRQAIEAGFFNYPFMQTDPFLDSVRHEPEFEQVLLMAREKHEAFKEEFFE